MFSTKLTQKDIKLLLSQWEIGEIRAVAEFTTGKANQTVQISTTEGDFVLRISGFYHKNLDQVASEGALLNCLKPKYSLVPKVYPTKTGQLAGEIETDGRKVVALLMEKMLGEIPQRYNCDNVRIIGEEMAKLHLAGQNCLEKPIRHKSKIKENLFDRVDIEGITNLEIKTFLQRGCNFEIDTSGLDLPDGLIHDDFNRSNLLFVENKLTAVLDFDEAKFGFWIQDVGGFLWNLIYHHLFKNEDLNLIQIFLQGYSTIRELNMDELDILPQFILLHNYGMSAFDFFGIDSQEALQEEIKIEHFLAKYSV